MVTIARFNEVKPLKDFKSDMPTVIEGVEAYMTLCPVSKLTGHRENPLSLLKTLATDPQKSRLLNEVVQDVSSLAVNSPKLSNDELISLAMDNLHAGTFFESDQQSEKYLSVVSDFVNSRRVDPSNKSGKQTDVKTDDDIIKDA